MGLRRQPSEEKVQVVTSPTLSAFVLENGDVYMVSPEGLMHVTNPISAGNPLILLFALIAMSSAIGGINTEAGTYHIARLKAGVPWLRKRSAVNPSVNLDAKLVRKIRGTPGIRLSDLKSAAPRNLSDLALHLQMLERSGTICSLTEGTKRRFYYVASSDERRPRVEEMRESLLCLVESQPGITEAEIARNLGLKQQLANYDLRLLSRAMVLF